MYLAKNLTLKKIAQMCEVSNDSLRKYMRKIRIKEQ